MASNVVGTTNVPAISWSSLGPIAPSGPSILGGLQQDFNVAFNVNFNWNASGSTPQGQLASSLAAIINNNNQIMVYYANQVNPAFATGRMQDAIGNLYFLTRNPAEPTQLTVNCTGGGTGVGITLQGLDLFTSNIATIKDNAGNLYQLLTTITLPAGGGIVQGVFACVTPGSSIEVPTGNNPISIYQAINGWDGVALISGVQGVDTESREAFEARRQDSVAGNSMGAASSVIGAVAKVSGVIDYFGYNNALASPVTIQGVTIPANSMYICVAGGAPSAIGQAILSKIGPGAPMAGNTIVTAYDNNPLYSSPIPYPIQYQTPTPLQLTFSVTLVASGAIPANAVTLVRNALLAAVTQGVVSPAAVFIGSITNNFLTVTQILQGQLAVGQILSDTTGAITGGTQITAFGTGSGGLGTYQVSVSQSVVSETISSVTNDNQIIPNLRARIADIIYATNYVQALAALGPWAQIANIQIGSANTAAAVFIGTISGTTLTVASVTSGVIAVGQTLFDTTGVIAPGTTILSGSGTTWTVNNSQTVGGATFTGSASAIGLTVSGIAGQISIGQAVSGTGIPAGTTITGQLSGTPGGNGVYLTSQATTASSASLTTATATFTGSASNYGLTVSGVTGSIAAGQLITGTGIPSNTTIVEQVSGTIGGAGVYITSNANTASAAAITTAETINGVTANQTLVSIQANQVPQLSGLNIAVGTT